MPCNWRKPWIAAGASDMSIVNLTGWSIRLLHAVSPLTYETFPTSADSRPAGVPEIHQVAAFCSSCVSSVGQQHATLQVRCFEQPKSRFRARPLHATVSFGSMLVVQAWPFQDTGQIVTHETEVRAYRERPVGPSAISSSKDKRSAKTLELRLSSPGA